MDGGMDDVDLQPRKGVHILRGQGVRPGEIGLKVTDVPVVPVALIGWRASSGTPWWYV